MLFQTLEPGIRGFWAILYLIGRTDYAIDTPHQCWMVLREKRKRFLLALLVFVLSLFPKGWVPILPFGGVLRAPFHWGFWPPFLEGFFRVFSPYLLCRRVGVNTRFLAHGALAFGDGGPFSSGKTFGAFTLGPSGELFPGSRLLWVPSAVILARAWIQSAVGVPHFIGGATIFYVNLQGGRIFGCAPPV